YPLWCAMYDSMGQYGILNIGATANGTWNVDQVGDIPTACPSDYLISVTNTNESDQKYPQAAYGDTTIDLGAPGTDILSTVPGNSYGLKTGTSSASPHVAGAVALLYSLPCSQFVQDYRSDPAGTALKIKSFILDGVDSITDLSVNYPTVSGGRLNVYNSLQLMAQYYNCDVGIDEVTSVNQTIFLYPNPANDLLHVVIKKPAANQQVLSVKNILGQTLIEKNLAPAARNLTLDISVLQSGIYFLNLEENNSIQTVKWVKE
ncbi:MAG: S8/S53 family peptidase, partial [Chitinophagales bacterium]